MKGAVTLLLSALVAGCGGSLDVAYVKTGPPLEAKPDTYDMLVYYNEDPGRPWREIAQIRVRSTREDATLDKVVSAAAEDARELGADAILVDVRRGFHHVELGVGCDGRPFAPPGRRLNARVTAIVFTGPGDASPERPPVGPTPIDTCSAAKGRH